MLKGQDCLLGDARCVHARTNRAMTASCSHGENLQVRNRDGISSVRRSKTPNLGASRTSAIRLLQILLMFRTRAHGKIAESDLSGQTKSRVSANCDRKVLENVSTGGSGTPQAWQYLPDPPGRRIVALTSAANCSRRTARYTNERARFRRSQRSRRGLTHRAPHRGGTTPGTADSPLGRQRMWCPLRLLSRTRLFHRGGIRGGGGTGWGPGDPSFPSPLPRRVEGGNRIPSRRR